LGVGSGTKVAPPPVPLQLSRLYVVCLNVLPAPVGDATSDQETLTIRQLSYDGNGRGVSEYDLRLRKDIGIQ